MYFAGLYKAIEATSEPVYHQRHVLKPSESRQPPTMPFTAVVTGANQGIGLEIARAFAQRPGTRTILAARNEERGRAALEKLRAELPAADLAMRQLDITDRASVASFASWAEQELKQIDVLVNNAGFAYKGNAFGAEEAATTVGVNFYGTVAVTEALKGLVPAGGRIINICSVAGKLAIIRSPQLRAQFEQASSVQELEALAEKFVGDIRSGRHAQEGWPNSMYGVSKLLESMYTRVLAAQMPQVMVNAVHPGYCSTGMSSFRGPQPASDGADTPAWLAFLPQEQWVSGKFFTDRKEEPF